MIDTDDYERGLDDAGSKTASFGDKLKSGLAKAAKAGAAAMTAATAAVTAFAKASIDTGAQFDSSMSQVAATMGTTVDEIQNLRDFAQEMGAKTAFSATQAADALNYMALAGYDAEQSMQALPNVLNLAAAGGIDLAAASDMVTDAQSALGLSMEESAELVDKMAMASSKSNTSVAQLGDAILTIGGTAKNLAGGTTELSTALGILADNGIKGAEGGTALRNIILSLSAPTDKAAASLEAMGVAVYDAQGNMRPLNDTFSDLEAALSTMTQGEQTEVLNEIFNKVDLKSVNALLANTGDRFDELSGYIDAAAGSAEAMANTQLDNFAGDITLLKSAVEGVQIAFSDKLVPALRTGTQFLTDLAGSAQEFIENGGLEKIVQLFTDLSPVIAAATAAFVAYKAATAISGIMEALTKATEAQTIAQAALNAILNANPFVLVATLIAAVGTALVTLYMTNEDFRNKVQEVWGKIKEIFSEAWEHIKSVWNEVKPYFSAAWEAIKVIWDNAVGYFENIWNTIKGIFEVVEAVLSGNFSDAWEAIKNVFLGWEEYFEGLWNTVTGIFSGVKEWFEDVGRNLLEGLWNGINDKVEWLKGKVTGVVDTIKGWFTGSGGFDEHSPSKWANQVFRYVMEGGGEGLEEGLPGLMGNVSNVVDSVKNGMQFGTANVDFSASGIGQSSAAIINSATGGEGGNVPVIPLTINLLTGESRPFAEWILGDLIAVARERGTPITSGIQYA